MGPLPQPSDDPKKYCSDEHQDPRCWPDPPPLPYPPAPPSRPASHGRSTFVTALIIAISVLAFLALCLSILFLVRRRRLRRRREALLEAALAVAPAGPAAFPDGGGGPGEDEEVVHHVWHIRTVGLDDAAIESIALTRYRAGGVLGASDCTVCLGEFQDGELLRLLPKCAHAFHVQCIDTWLRAHVSCPLCRADVMVDPASAATGAANAEQPPAADAAADASAEQPASNTRTMELERRSDQQANEQQELRVQIDQPADHSSSLDRPHRQIRRPGARAQNFRRVASMDLPWPPTAESGEEAPEDEQAGGEKQGTGGAVCCAVSVSPGPGQLNRPAMKRSLSASSRWTLLSRHCRTRSSLLPL